MSRNTLYVQYQSSHPSHASPKMDSPEDSRYFRSNFEGYIPRNKKAQILDIGCGAGYFLQDVQARGYKNFFGIDISEQQIAFCKSKNLGDHVTRVDDVVRFLTKRKGTFDFIIMNDVIEHLEKDTIVPILIAVYRALKRGGIFVVKTENLNNRWGSAVRYMDFTHTVGFTPESLSQALFLGGFRTIRFHSEIHPIHDIKSFVRVILKTLFESVHKLEYLASFGTHRVDVGNMLIAIATK